MQYTEQQKAEFKLAYAKRRTRQLVVAAVLVPLVIAMAVSDNKEAGTVFGVSAAVGGPAFFAVMLVAVVFSFRNWRCPACSSYLGRAFNPRHCSNCGVELRA